METEFSFNSFNDGVAERLTKFHFRSILNHSLLELNKLWGKKPFELIQAKEMVPWNILRVIVWSAKYSPEYTFGREISDNEYDSLYAEISNAPLPEQVMKESGADPWALLRCLLFNQIPYQSGTGHHGHLVESIIFNRFMGGYDFTPLQNGFGLKLPDLLQLKYMVLLFFGYSQRPQFVPVKNFRGIFEGYPEETVFAFFNQICLPYGGIRDICRDFFDRLSDPSSVYYSRFPFYEKPLVKYSGDDDSIGERYCPIDQVSIIEWLNYGLYNRLKKDDPDKFPRDFGEGFQNYINLSLTSLGRRFFGEADISKIVSGKVCDFVLEIDECRFFIECKSMEWHHGIFVNPSKEGILHAFSSSVIKGYRQIGNTWKHYSAHDDGKLNIGLVLTYKFLPFGNSLEVWSSIGTECPNCSDIYEGIFVLSCYEFETLFYRHRREGFDLRDYFEGKIAKNRGEPGNRCSPMEFFDSAYNVDTEAAHLIEEMNIKQVLIRSAFGAP